MFLEGYRNEGRNERNWCDVRPWAPHSRQPSAPQYSTQSCFEASFFFFIGLLFVLFLAPSLPVVTDEHNARKIYSNSCPHKRKKTKLLSARCADSKNIFLSIEQNSKFAHIQKEKKNHTAVVDCLSLRTPVKHCLAKTNEHVPSCCDK